MPNTPPEANTSITPDQLNELAARETSNNADVGYGLAAAAQS